MEKKKQPGIYFTVTEKEKRRIKRNAENCGLNQSEYIRQRALGFAPKAVPPDAFYHFCEKLDALCEEPFSAEVNHKALTLLAEIEQVLVRPTKEVLPWQPQASGPSEDG
ncbi:MAG: hypothetical protein E7570_02270 [Ruminococcaceae bacterium]|nr:hypothetical protein [Oscillospiraceae bacterium]